MNPIPLALLSLSISLTLTTAATPTSSEFSFLHNLIKPAPGESRWMEITWFPSIWEARQQAATQGKPIFLLAGSGGAPVAGC